MKIAKGIWAYQKALFAGRDSLISHLSRGMPYKDPERKRQWEQAHRRQRSERRMARRAQMPESARTETSHPPDPATHETEKGHGWAVALLFAGIIFGLPILFARPRSGQ
jgi:hypothetical protein